MRNLLKDKTGSVPVLTFGFVFLLLLLTFLTVDGLYLRELRLLYGCAPALMQQRC